MKKLVAVFAVVALLVVAAPVFAATNPFMDVPMNHWAYDAVASLAAKGILSGYPDGLYKGKQSMTRYEVASAVARALSYVDMTTASKQDVEMLKKLVVEFKDELDALGVRVDALEEGFGKMNARLGGWKISGILRADIDYNSDTDVNRDTLETEDTVSQATVGVQRARLFFDRWFGENEDMYFHTRLNTGNSASAAAQAPVFARFYVTLPIGFDMKLTAGRHAWNLENVFGYVTPGPGRYDNAESWVTDIEQPMIGIAKNFGIGNFRAYVAQGRALPDSGNAGDRAWELNAAFNFNPTESLGITLGGQYLKYDNGAVKNDDAAQYWNNMTTGWLQASFGFMQDMAFHGAVYFQSVGQENDWKGDADLGGTSYKFALTFGQEMLKFTNLYLGYAKAPQGFFLRSNGLNSIYVAQSDPSNSLAGSTVRELLVDGGFTTSDISVFTIGANQKWNDKWSTWLYFEQGKHGWNSDFLDDSTTRGYGVGLEYAHNANTFFGLNYQHLSFTDGLLDGYGGGRVRFTTEVSF